MKKSNGFTIVEILVVIVVIGVLAAITIISYTGITRKVTITSMQSDLTDAAQQIKLFQLYNLAGNYPTANNCTNTASTEICLKTNGSNYYAAGSYIYNNSSSPKTYQLDITNGNLKYRITNDSTPVEVITTITLADTDPANWLAIGNQVWAKHNLNVGTMVTGVTTQTNNAVVEKYCFGNTEPNCTANGGLYQWDEAMQYVNTQGAQGICPTGSHIPSDNDWKVLEIQLGMTQVAADTGSAWRGTDQGVKLKSGGVSGLSLPLAGYRNIDWQFGASSNALLWSSSESSTSAWERSLYSGYDTVYRGTDPKGRGFSVRCVGN